MRSRKRVLVVAIPLLILGALGLGVPPPAAAGPAISRARLTLDLTESQCVDKARRAVSDLRRIDRSIRSEVDDDTVWLSNDSFTAMILCLGIRDQTLALIVVASASGDLAGAIRDDLKRGMR